MRRELRNYFSRLVVGASFGMAALLLAASPSLGQSSGGSSAGSNSSPGQTASPSNSSNNASSRDTGRDSARDTTETDRDSSSDRSSRNNFSTNRDDQDDAWKNTRDAARDTSRSARDAARETSRSARDAYQDTRDSARGAARDTARSARDAWQDDRDDDRDRDDRGGRSYDRYSSDARDRDSDARFTDRDSRNRDLRDRDDRFSDRDMRDRDDRFDDRDSRDRFDDRRDSDRLDRSSRDVSRNRSSTRFDASRVRIGDLGVNITTRDNNLLITSVSRGPFSTFGFRENDYLYSVNGQRISNEQMFVRTLLSSNVDEVPVVVYRGGRYVTLYVEPSVIIREYSDDSYVARDSSYTTYDPMRQFGVILDDGTSDRIVVRRVISGTPAYYSGLRAGDVITTWHGRRIAGPRQFTQVFEDIEPGEIDFQVTRNNQPRTLQVDIPQSFVSQHTTFRRDYDLDNNNNNRIDRQDLRMERREDRRDIRWNDGVNTTVPGANVYTPGADVNVYRGGVNVATPRGDINVATPRRGLLFPRR